MAATLTCLSSAGFMGTSAIHLPTHYYNHVRLTSVCHKIPCTCFALNRASRAGWGQLRIGWCASAAIVASSILPMRRRRSIGRNRWTKDWSWCISTSAGWPRKSACRGRACWSGACATPMAAGKCSRCAGRGRLTSFSAALRGLARHCLRPFTYRARL